MDGRVAFVPWKTKVITATFFDLIVSRALGLLGRTETLVEATSVYSFLLRQYPGT